MSMNVKSELVTLSKQPLPQLKSRYEGLYGETARSNHRTHLIKRILWRMQANEQGDLPDRARRRAEELSRDVDIRVRPPRGYLEAEAAEAMVVTGILRRDRPDEGPMPGSLLRRSYKGRTVSVRVLDRGFEYEGEVYRSLSAIAKKVTNTHLNGRAFFGISTAVGRDSA